MSRNIAPMTPEFTNYIGTHPVARGGFGVSTEEAIRRSIGGVDRNDLSVGGVIRIGPDGKAIVDSNMTFVADFTTLIGPEFYSYLEPTCYEITSYTPFKEYNIYIKENQEIDIIRSDEFFYLPQGLDYATLTLVINGRELVLKRIPSGMDKPTVVVSGFRDVSTDTISVIGSKYHSAFDGKLVSVQAQVSKNADFSNIVDDKTVTADAGYQGVDFNVQKGLVVYTRLRYLDTSKLWSDWSTGVICDTSTLSNAISTPIIRGTGFKSKGGVRISMTAFKSLSKAGAPHTTTEWVVATDAAFTTLIVNKGPSTVSLLAVKEEIVTAAPTLYVRARFNNAGTTGAWGNTVVLNTTDMAAYGDFVSNSNLLGGSFSSAIGQNSYFSEDGSNFITCEDNKINIYKRDTPGRWILVKSFFANPKAKATDNKIVYMAASDTTIAAMVDNTVYFYKFADGNWRLRNSVTKPVVAGASYGEFMSVSGDGTLVAISNYLTTSSTTAQGNVELMKYNAAKDIFELSKTYSYKDAAKADLTEKVQQLRCRLSYDGRYLVMGSGRTYTSQGSLNIVTLSNDSYIFKAAETTGGEQFGTNCLISKDNSLIAVISAGDVNPPGNRPKAKVTFYSFNGTVLGLLNTVVTDVGAVTTPDTNVGRHCSATHDLSLVVMGDIYNNNGRGSVIVVRKVAASTWEKYDSVYLDVTENNKRHGDRVVISCEGKYIACTGYNSNAKTPANIEIRRQQTELNTNAVYREAIYTSTGAPTTLMGRSCRITDDGKRVLVGCPGDETYGTARLFDLVDGKWTLTYTFKPFATTPTGEKNNDLFYGYDVFINGDGTSVAISAPGRSTGSNTRNGMIFFYKWVTNAWVEELVPAQTPIDNSWSGRKVALNPAGNAFIFSAEAESTLTLPGTLSVSTGTYDGATKKWAVKYSDPINLSLAGAANHKTYKTGMDIKITASGNNAIISNNIANNGTGQCVIYGLTSGYFTSRTVLQTPALVTTVGTWGSAVALNDATDVAVIADAGTINPGSKLKGSATIYKVAATALTADTTIMATDLGNSVTGLVEAFVTVDCDATGDVVTIGSRIKNIATDGSTGMVFHKYKRDSVTKKHVLVSVTPVYGDFNETLNNCHQNPKSTSLVVTGSAKSSVDATKAKDVNIATIK